MYSILLVIDGKVRISLRMVFMFVLLTGVHGFIAVDVWCGNDGVLNCSLHRKDLLNRAQSFARVLQYLSLYICTM